MNLTSYAVKRFAYTGNTSVPFEVVYEPLGSIRITKDSDCPSCFPDAFAVLYPSTPSATICLCMYRPDNGPTSDSKAMMMSEGHTCISLIEHWKADSTLTCKKCLKYKGKQTLPAYKPMPPGTRFK
jgi:hypothetical protein